LMTVGRYVRTHARSIDRGEESRVEWSGVEYRTSKSIRVRGVIPRNGKYGVWSME
jgi:hypothetical protein